MKEEKKKETIFIEEMNYVLMTFWDPSQSPVASGYWLSKPELFKDGVVITCPLGGVERPGMESGQS